MASVPQISDLKHVFPILITFTTTHSMSSSCHFGVAFGDFLSLFSTHRCTTRPSTPKTSPPPPVGSARPKQSAPNKKRLQMSCSNRQYEANSMYMCVVQMWYIHVVHTCVTCVCTCTGFSSSYVIIFR